MKLKTDQEIDDTISESTDHSETQVEPKENVISVEDEIERKSAFFAWAEAKTKKTKF
jgi:hypothetical protein